MIDATDAVGEFPVDRNDAGRQDLRGRGGAGEL
jgi:hypothetical protein